MNSSIKLTDFTTFSIILNIVLLTYVCFHMNDQPLLKNDQFNSRRSVETSYNRRRLSLPDPKTMMRKPFFGDISNELTDTLLPEEVFKMSRAQMQQDQFIYMNFFRGKKNGVYLDVGANEAEFISNTYMFEKALDWTGICFEPGKEYHDEWAQKRSCNLIKKMVAGTASNNPDEISLAEILDYSRITHIDFISLDVEGMEIEILENFDFKKYDVSVWLVETFWLDDRIVDHIMLTNGYYKAAQLAIDALYVKVQDDNDSPMWYAPRELVEFWPNHQKWRCEKNTQSLLAAKTAPFCDPENVNTLTGQSE